MGISLGGIVCGEVASRKQKRFCVIINVAGIIFAAPRVIVVRKSPEIGPEMTIWRLRGLQCTGNNQDITRAI